MVNEIIRKLKCGPKFYGANMEKLNINVADFENKAIINT